MLGEADRHGGFDRASHARQTFRKIVRAEGQAHCVHPAAYVDPHRGGDDGLLRRDDAAHRCADPLVNVRHGGDVPVHDRQLRHVDELL